MATITHDAAGGADVTAFLDLLAFSEGTSSSPVTKNAGYDVIVTGVDGPEAFTDYTHHPFFNRPAKLIVAPGPRFPGGLRSTAAGRYQLLFRYFAPYKAQLHLPDFGPLSQDLIAIEQMKERGALAHLKAGAIDKAIAAHLTSPDLDEAIEDAAAIWASLPGNAYGQGGHSLEALVVKYEEIWSASFL